MLGRFLEVALVTPDPHAGWEMYQRLGFTPAETGDIWPHSYGVVCCGGLSLGLHAAGADPLTLCSVRPNVLALHRELEALDIETDSAQLGPDVFNQLVLREPGGVALKVMEARSFTPPMEAPVRTLLGRFETLSVPIRDPDAAAAFWSRMDFTLRDATPPLGSMELDGELPIAYHPRESCPEPVLVFRSDGLALDLPALLASGLTRGRSLPAMAGIDYHLLRSPGEIGLLLLA